MGDNQWRQHRGRILFWGVLFVALLLVLVMTFRPHPVWVDTAMVLRQDLEVTIVEQGYSRVQDRYVVSAPVAGYLRRIELNVGDPVQPGQLLTELEPLRSTALDARSRAEAGAREAAAKAALGASEQQVAAAQADQDLAISELSRLQKLAAQKLVSEESLQQAQATAQRSAAALRSARFAVDVARHELAAVRTHLRVSAASTGGESTDLVSIKSPIAGAVLQLLRQSEGVVSAGQSLLELGDPAALEVAVEVQSFDAVKLRPAMPVRLTGWGGEALAAMVRTVEPVGFTDVSALGVEEQRVRVVVDITSAAPLWQSLGDGYRVDAHFILWQGADVLSVPESAVFRIEDQPHVFIVEGERATLRAVRVGRSDGFRIQVHDGLEDNEQVVRHPDNSLSDGVRVRTRL